MNLNDTADLHLISGDDTAVTRAKRPLPGRTVYTEEARQNRLNNISEQTGVELSTLREMRLDSKRLRGNIECLAGAVEIPVGVAGPLLIHGSQFDAEVFAPIATTEGALVSSINRGCRAISMSGGVTARSIKQRMVRSPLFDCENINECLRLKNWIQLRRAEIQKHVRNHSNYAVLIDLEFSVIAPCLHVRFIYETGDASGQNMTTICTWNVCQWILAEYKKDSPEGIRHFMVEGNLSSDKKASSSSAILGRGREVVAEVFLPNSVVRRVFNTTAEDLVRSLSQSHSTQILTGMHGMNINVANVIAGIFAATGQDIACVHESSLGQLHFELRNDTARGPGLYASLILPTLVIGTVGGGVSLPAQKQLLEMIGCYGAGKSTRFAETIASFALALELSTGAAMASGQFAEAHERLGRNKTESWLKKSDLTVGFFNHILEKRTSALGKIIEVQPRETDEFEDSFVMTMAGQISRRPCGLWLYDVRFSEALAKQKILVKLKAADDELLLAFEIIAGLKSPGLGDLLRENRADSLFNGSAERELAIATLNCPEIEAISPKCFGVIQNASRSTYLMATEYLENVSLMGAVEQRELWERRFIEAALLGISSVHARFYQRTAPLLDNSWLHVFDSARVSRLQEAHAELARQLFNESMGWFTENDLLFHEIELPKLIASWPELEKMPATLIHNDFNPRNLAFRNNSLEPQLVAFDWELATIGIAQRDLAELLAFTLSHDVTYEELNSYVEFHRRSIEALTGRGVDRDQWVRGFELALLDFILQRLPIYVIAQSFKKVPFLKPSYRVARHLLEMIRKVDGRE